MKVYRGPSSDCFNREEVDSFTSEEFAKKLVNDSFFSFNITKSHLAGSSDCELRLTIEDKSMLYKELKCFFEDEHYI